jgi:transcriptional regulator with XRE-family HTH domain
MKVANTTLIKMVLKELGLNQKELAMRVGVSPTQITKWKKGEHMSEEMRDSLSFFIDIDGRDADILELVGAENYDNWFAFIGHMADSANESGETGYIASIFHNDERNMLVYFTLMALKEMNIDFKIEVPESLVFDYDDYELLEVRSSNSLYCMIEKAYSALDDISGFCNAYIYPVVFGDHSDRMTEVFYDLEYKSIALSFIKTMDSEKAQRSNNFGADFIDGVVSEVRNYAKEIKLYAIKNNIPLGAELLNIVSKTSGDLGTEAEQEYLGFNDDRLHPDIYMHELLQGNRVINQALPLVCEKLGITDIEFKNLTLGL